MIRDETCTFMTQVANITANRRPRFLYLLSVAQRRVQAAAQGNADNSTSARAGLLMLLRPDGTPVATKHIAQQLSLSPSSLSGLLDRMASDGLIERVADASDKRAINIILTSDGQSQRTEAVRVSRILNDQLCDGFKDDELQIVARWLEAAAAKFPKGDIA